MLYWWVKLSAILRTPLRNSLKLACKPGGMSQYTAINSLISWPRSTSIHCLKVYFKTLEYLGYKIHSLELIIKSLKTPGFS